MNLHFSRILAPKNHHYMSLLLRLAQDSNMVNISMASVFAVYSTFSRRAIYWFHFQKIFYQGSHFGSNSTTHVLSSLPLPKAVLQSKELQNEGVDISYLRRSARSTSRLMPVSCL